MYKVVRRLKNGARVSAVVHKNTGFRQTYQANGENLTVKQGLAFSSLEEAKKFISDPDSEIWTCSYDNELPLPKYRCRNSCFLYYNYNFYSNEAIKLAAKALKEALKNGNVDAHFIYAEARNYWPKDTVNLSNIVLTERIR